MLYFSDGQKTLVLSPNDFSALTNQMGVNKSSAPTKIRIVQPMSPANIKTEPTIEKHDFQVRLQSLIL